MHVGGGFVGESNLGVGEAGPLQPGEVFVARERAGDASNVGVALGRGQVVLGDYVEMPIRPPCVSTRNISVSTAGLSVDRFMTQLESTTPTIESSRGSSSTGW